jgi:hypothetical protein
MAEALTDTERDARFYALTKTQLPVFRFEGVWEIVRFFRKSDDSSARLSSESSSILSFGMLEATR